jgi:hypothetical protein
MRAFILLLPLLLIACGVPPDDRAPAAAPEGRAETQNIRNTDAVGYSGSAIADKVDAALDTSERRQDDLDA